MTNTYPFGKASEAKQADNNAPQAKSNDPNLTVPAPSGVNKDVWAEAERSIRNQSGGFAGVGEDGRVKQVQTVYDQMVKNDTDHKAAHDGDGILGDIGQKA